MINVRLVRLRLGKGIHSFLGSFLGFLGWFFHLQRFPIGFSFNLGSQDALALAIRIHQELL
jgi:hypothetical protein